MKKLLLFFLVLFLPLVSFGQSAEECYKKGEDYLYKADYQNALMWYEKAANQGHVNAQSHLGLMYNNGLGVTKDYVKAVEWYQKAANQGKASAQYELGKMYENGYGVSKDYKKALDWYHKAANQGNANAQDHLGYMYNNGIGVSRDCVKAIEWYEKAANQGYVSAQQSLGHMYEDDKGVKVDYAKAVEWYEKASNQGDEHAKYRLEILQNKMAEENYDLAQTTKTPVQKPSEQPKPVVKQTKAESKQVVQEKPNEQPKQVVQSQPHTQPQTKVEIDLVDTDIPVISRVNKNTFALIFANENYTRETKVDYARNDGEVFRDYCRKTLGLPEKHIHFMPDATLNDLIGELDWLQQVCESYGGEANVIFYYAGHGIPDEATGSAYLLPTDGNSRILRTCFSIDELYKMLGSMPAKKVTVLMDACFSGAKRNGDMLASARGIAIKAKAGAPKGNTIVLSAAQGDETAYKYEDAKHGLFTYFLLKKLKDSKGDVTLGELSNYVQTYVKRYSIVENGKLQTPTIMTSGNLHDNWKELTIY